jgi:acyl-CoA reductase-like NAD-dependent aldehyde dehydrogenase
MIARSVDFTAFFNCIDGDLRTSPSLHNGTNPSDKSNLWNVPVATEKDLNDAVASAQRAFRSWSEVSWEERTKLLGQAREALLQYKDQIADILVQENGKPVRIP